MKNNSPYKSYKICAYGPCSRGIVRGGVTHQEKVGFGYSHDKKYYHKACLRKALRGYNTTLIGNMFRAVRKYKEVDVDLKHNFFGIKI